MILKKTTLISGQDHANLTVCASLLEMIKSGRRKGEWNQRLRLISGPLLALPLFLKGLVGCCFHQLTGSSTTVFAACHLVVCRRDEFQSKRESALKKTNHEWLTADSTKFWLHLIHRFRLFCLLSNVGKELCCLTCCMLQCNFIL